jgi:D-glycero-alpha-D-manno-heptose-7-phosphate kinase
MADIPAGTGLGSSGSFTTALLKGLRTVRRQMAHPEMIAADACHIELDLLGEPIGKQDQYIAAYGGLTCFEFCPKGKVKAWPLRVSDETRNELEDNLLLFYTGRSREASSILRDQDSRSRQNDQTMTDSLHFTKELAFRTCEVLENGDLPAFGELLHLHWERKRERSRGMSSSEIDAWV